jgi:hypothetical protein
LNVPFFKFWDWVVCIHYNVNALHRAMCLPTTSRIHTNSWFIKSHTQRIIVKKNHNILACTHYSLFSLHGYCTKNNRKI